MTDKYKKFKEWVNKENNIMFGNICWEKIFSKYEKEYDENLHKKEIIDVIWDTFSINTLRIEYEICGIHPAEAVYIELKKRNLIK